MAGAAVLNPLGIETEGNVAECTGTLPQIPCLLLPSEI